MPLASQLQSPTFDLWSRNRPPCTVEPPKLKAGDIVEIQDGPLRGLQGVFEREMSDRDRVIVLLEVLAKGARVEVRRGAVEKLTCA